MVTRNGVCRQSPWPRQIQPQGIRKRRATEDRPTNDQVALVAVAKRECQVYALVTILYPYSTRRPRRCGGRFAQTSFTRRGHPATVRRNLFIPAAGPTDRAEGHEILREEMNAIGGQEFYLPALHPAEIWQESGRWDAIGDEMFRLKDRKGTDMCLGMTHEEVFTTIARNELRSYKQLPQVWYQIQIKFRDEARPKSGLMRVRDVHHERRILVRRRSRRARQVVHRSA